MSDDTPPIPSIPLTTAGDRSYAVRCTIWHPTREYDENGMRLRHRDPEPPIRVHDAILGTFDVNGGTPPLPLHAFTRLRGLTRKVLMLDDDGHGGVVPNLTREQYVALCGERGTDPAPLLYLWDEPTDVSP